MKTRKPVLAGLFLGTIAVCLFLDHRNRALVGDLTQLRERNIRLESVQTENADLERSLSRERAVAWELETLRQQARDVHRLRAQGNELLQFRRENQEMTLRLGELAQQNEQLQLAARTSPGALGVPPRESAPIPVPVAYEFDDSFRQFFGQDGVAAVERALGILADQRAPLDLLTDPLRLDGW